MVLFQWVSIVLHIAQIYYTVTANDLYITAKYSVLRAPRPLILIRVFRAVLRLQLPPARVNAIFQRSTHQIYNVSIFLLFSMSLYGLLGVQFFGNEINKHCVRSEADVNNISIEDLAIPDTYCKIAEHDCPPDMRCVRINHVRPKHNDGGYANFTHFFVSIFTVYQAASQEGWVFIMYRSMDCLQSWMSVAYFLSLIFFLAWLVKNVFIAVLIETFAEIRVQFQQMWSPRGSAGLDCSKVFQFDGTSWKLVPVHETKVKGLAPRFFQEER
ncbi:hypothetical protein Ciccas_003257 [Cichlidogyrus casuarinus]|uniref:Ion transport domain-containing protein n=1 Tax=Cichlidogyrus casuarinus TaxID=1844966 RepID=A0ABD2QEV2_9PLAT